MTADSVSPAHDGRLVETDRLRLRWFTIDDAPLMLEIWNSPDFLRFVGDRQIRSLEHARDVLSRTTLLDYERYGYGAFHVSLKSGEAVGICGLFQREELAHPDLGFAVLPCHYRHGYAFEAASAVLNDCDRNIGLRIVDAIVAPDNRASIRLLEKLGMRYEAMIRLDDDDSSVRLYRRERGQWP